MAVAEHDLVVARAELLDVAVGFALQTRSPEQPPAGLAGLLLGSFAPFAANLYPLGDR